MTFERVKPEGKEPEILSVFSRLVSDWLVCVSVSFSLGSFSVDWTCLSLVLVVFGLFQVIFPLISQFVSLFLLVCLI